MPNDADALAELIDFAGEGLPHYLWEKMAASGETAWDVGRRRARRESGSFSYRNAYVVEADDADRKGRAVACLIGYALPETPAAIDHDRMPPMFLPLQELENLAPGTWYVNVLAAYPDDRGRGCGTALLGLADRLAIEAACRGTSIIVADTNRRARRLYERCGYVERATRPVVTNGWRTEAENWVLLVKGG